MMIGADTLLMIGTIFPYDFPYSEWLPKEGQCRAVEIDIDGRMIECGTRSRRILWVMPKRRCES
jgi:pyruvate dehydrogenase (quinone)